MTTHLVPCLGCARHVRVSETLCPFCATALPDDLRAQLPRVWPATRLSRAAAYALGSGRARAVVLATGTALAAATAGCSMEVAMPLYGAPADLGVDHDAASAQDSGTPTDAGAIDAATTDAATDGGTMMTHYGTPPDAGVHQDAGVDLGGPMADYGSPP